MGDDPSIPPWEAVVTATALDVSRHGLRLKAFYNTSIGSLMSAIVYFKGRESVCLCEVVWKRENMGEFLYGLYIKEWSKIAPTLEGSFRAMETAAGVDPGSGVDGAAAEPLLA